MILVKLDDGCFSRVRMNLIVRIFNATLNRGNRCSHVPYRCERLEILDFSEQQCLFKDRILRPFIASCSSVLNNGRLWVNYLIIGHASSLYLYPIVYHR